MQSKFLSKLRQQNPLVHNITNIVAANFSANGLLAIGASPIMSASIEEMVEVPNISQALVINIGTLLGKDVAAMVLAGKTANQIGIPVVLDPVGVAATTFRQQTVATLLKEVRFAAIRGNAGELAYLAGVNWAAKGVDAGSGAADLAAIAHQVARQYGCIAVISGATDFISDGVRLAKLHNGTPTSVFWFLAIGFVIQGLTFGPMAVLLPELFPTEVRYSGAALAYTVAGIVGGSVFTVFSVKINANFGLIGIGIYLAAISLITCLALWKLPETKQLELAEI